jgi:hypothetical protein
VYELYFNGAFCFRRLSVRFHRGAAAHFIDVGFIELPLLHVANVEVQRPPDVVRWGDRVGDFLGRQQRAVPTAMTSWRTAAKGQ